MPPRSTPTARPADVNKPWVPRLCKAFQSPKVKTLVEAAFSGALVPAF